MNIDQQTDKSKKVLYTILGTLKDTGLKARIKGATMDPKKTEALESKHFAYPMKRLFPVDTKDNTILSMAYFEHQKDALPKAEVSKIKKALDVKSRLFNIPTADFTKVAATESVDEAPAAPRFLLPERQFCKVACCEDIGKAETLFDVGFQNLDLTDRVEFATNFVKAAEEFKANFSSENIEKYAGVLDYDSAHTQYVLELRAGAVKYMGGDTTLFNKLASELSGLTDDPTHEELDGLVKIIESLDKQAGIHEKDYDRTIHSPHGAVFHKKAAESSETTEGKTSKLSKADIVGEFGDDVLDMVEKEDGSIDYEALEKVKSLKNGLGSANVK